MTHFTSSQRTRIRIGHSLCSSPLVGVSIVFSLVLTYLLVEQVRATQTAIFVLIYYRSRDSVVVML